MPAKQSDKYSMRFARLFVIIWRYF